MTGRDYVSGVILLCTASATLGWLLGPLGVLLAVLATIFVGIVERRL